MRNFEPLESIEAWETFVGVIFGPAGTGKTWLASSSGEVESMTPVLLLDTSGGSRSIRGVKGKFTNITSVPITNFNDMIMLCNWIGGTIKPRDLKYFENLDNVIGGVENLKTLIIDDFSVLNDLSLADVIKDNPQVNRYYDDVPTQSDYGANRIRIKNLVIKLISMCEQRKINLILTCHAQLDKNELDIVTKIRPELSGKLSHEIPAKFTAVGYMDMKLQRKGEGEPIRTINFTHTKNKAEVKDHCGLLGVIENPTMKIIMNKLQEIK